MVQIQYDPKAACPLFDKFLSEIMCSKPLLVEYLWRIMGYSLTGSTREQCWWLFLGEGENGKSTLLQIWRALLGPYAKHVETTETFIAKQPGAIRNDLARLRGARLVTAIEVERQHKLAEAMTKQVTGEDPITCRFLHKEHFEYMPEFKAIIAANNRPIIRGRDHAIWRRVRCLPFDYKVPKADKQLAENLKQELPGILGHAVRSCLDWQKDGMQTPEEVITAVTKYKEAMDLLKPFFDECCVADHNPDRWDYAANLYSAYLEWHGEEKAMRKNAFGSALNDRGFLKATDGKQRLWRGIELLAEFKPKPKRKRKSKRKQEPGEE
jgi:putative DNA primase/helicase